VLAGQGSGSNQFLVSGSYGNDLFVMTPDGGTGTLSPASPPTPWSAP
jgi:hypothetical protein